MDQARVLRLVVVLIVCSVGLLSLGSVADEKHTLLFRSQTIDISPSSSLHNNSEFVESLSVPYSHPILSVLSSRSASAATLISARIGGTIGKMLRSEVVSQYVVHVSGPIDESLKERLAQSLETDVLNYVPHHSFIVNARYSAIESAMSGPLKGTILWVGHVEDRLKIHPDIFAHVQSRQRELAEGPQLWRQGAQKRKKDANIDLFGILEDFEEGYPSSDEIPDASQSTVFEDRFHSDQLRVLLLRERNSGSRDGQTTASDKVDIAHELGTLLNTGIQHSSVFRQMSAVHSDNKPLATCVAISDQQVICSCHHKSENADSSEFESEEESDELKPIDSLQVMAEILAADPKVHWIELVPKDYIDNKYALSIVHNGVTLFSDNMKKSSKYHDAGLTGAGQIIGINDSGLDYLNCAFFDPNSPVSIIRDPRTQKLPSTAHRKVAGYWACIDEYELNGGHGTHTSGTVAGNANQKYAFDAEFKGVAPEARLLFTDIGCATKAGCTCPSSVPCGCLSYSNHMCPYSTTSVFSPWSYKTDLLGWNYRNGARIQTNSWGGGVGNGYSGTSMEIDEFLWDHQDAVVVWSAGNSGGTFGQGSLGAQAESKNTITVGASDSMNQPRKDEAEFLVDYKAREADMVSTMSNWCNIKDVSGFSYNPHACQFWNSTILPMFRPNETYNDASSPCCSKQGYCASSKCGCRFSNRWGRTGDSCCKSCVTSSVESGVDESPFYVSSYSSQGPTWDGRIKPDVVAPGTWIISACASSRRCDDLETKDKLWEHLIVKSGTSMATPHVAGNAAIVRQYFMEGYHPSGTRNPDDAFVPSGALIKAMLIQSGIPLRYFYNTKQGKWQLFASTRLQPHTIQGFGLVQLDSILKVNGLEDTASLTQQPQRVWLTRENHKIRTGRIQEYVIAVVNDSVYGIQPLKITLVWYDYPGDPATKKILVNDLDLEVRRVYFTKVYYGNDVEDTGQPDRLNNVEQVVIPQPQQGTWVIRVVGADVPMGPQQYALVITGSFEMISGSESVVFSGGNHRVTAFAVMLCMFLLLVT